jgi:hypothetical protein
MARKRLPGEALTRGRLHDLQGGTPPASAGARRLLAPAERSLQAEARKGNLERRAAQKRIGALQAPLIQLVSEQPNYERLARQQRVAVPKLPRYYRHSAGSQIEPGMRAVRVFSAVPPYTYDWTWNWEEPGSHGMPSVNKSTGQFGGHSDNVASCASGVGIFYRPQAAEAWAQSVSVIKFGIHYVANSHFMTAHTTASINVMVLSTDLAGGDEQVLVDQRTPMFDVTSNQLTNQSYNVDNREFRSRVEFLARNQRKHFLWTWCEVHTWGHDGTTPNWSQAYGNLWATALNIAIWY